MTPRRGRLVVCAVACALVLSACTTDWSTWGNGTRRAGESRVERTLTPNNVGSLRQKWAVGLGRTISAAPIFAHHINVNGTRRDLLYTGTEDGFVFAVSTSGAVIWSRYVGTVSVPCGDFPNRVHGITGSPVFDRASNRVYVVGGNGYAYALDASSGATVPGWPVQLTTTPAKEIVWSPPTLAGRNLYVSFASDCDAAPYRGRIVDIDPKTHTIVHTFYVAKQSGVGGGGIWGWGGVSADPANGDVYTATGNLLSSPENAPYGDAIVRLSSALVVKAFHTPTTQMGDDDFGSTPTLFQKTGCPPQLAVLQKNGSLYLYDRDALANGFRQRIAFGNANLIGVVAFSDATQMLYVINSSASAFKQGVVAFRFNASCKLTTAWNAAVPVSGGASPIVANGVVYVPGGRSNNVYALRATNGALLWQSATFGAAFYAEPIVVDGRVYAVGWDGRLHCWGL